MNNFYKVLFGILFFFFLFSNIVSAHGDEEHDFVIQISDAGFSPKELVINTGDTVNFENVGSEDHWPASDVHPTHSDYSEFDPRSPIKPYESWSFTFDQEGEWEFHDHLFPMFIGKVVVNDFENEKSLGQKISDLFSFFKKVPKNILSFFSKNDEIPDSRKETFVNTEFKEPKKYDQELVENFSTGCDLKNHGCISNSLKGLTREYGPAASIEALRFSIDNGKIDKTVNDHQLSHEIGREAARIYGVNSEAFLLCPMSAFNGGCQHGFFEYVLGKTDTSTEAAELICDSLGDEFSNKFKFYCYHGVGHGVMMAEAYDLDSSLQTCDSFGEHSAQEGCWQGVFMENTNAGTGGFAREGIFSQDDPLAPCSELDHKYKYQCYINHSGYIMKFFGNDVFKATTACLEAEDDFIDSCLESIGLMSTNPVWQDSLLKDHNSTLNSEEKAWEICKMFPDEKREQCVVGGLDNIVNFDENDVSRANRFCSLVDSEHKRSCYELIGIRLKNDTVSNDDLTEVCNKLNPEGESYCLDGIGI